MIGHMFCLLVYLLIYREIYPHEHCTLVIHTFAISTQFWFAGLCIQYRNWEKEWKQAEKRHTFELSHHKNYFFLLFVLCSACVLCMICSMPMHQSYDPNRLQAFSIRLFFCLSWVFFYFPIRSVLFVKFWLNCMCNLECKQLKRIFFQYKYLKRIYCYYAVRWREKMRSTQSTYAIETETKWDREVKSNKRSIYHVYVYQCVHSIYTQAAGTQRFTLYDGLWFQWFLVLFHFVSVCLNFSRFLLGTIWLYKYTHISHSSEFNERHWAKSLPHLVIVDLSIEIDTRNNNKYRIIKKRTVYTLFNALMNAISVHTMFALFEFSPYYIITSC